MQRSTVLTVAKAAALLGSLILLFKTIANEQTTDSEYDIDKNDYDTASNLLNELTAAGHMNISEQAIEYIKRNEGLALKPYFDYAGHSVGYGHLIKAGDGISDTDTITKERAEELLREDIKLHENAVNSAIKVDLTQYEFDALCIFCHGCGQRALTRSISGFINDGNKQSAVETIKKYIYVTVGGVKQVHTGLVKRRAKDALIFTAGIYS